MNQSVISSIRRASTLATQSSPPRESIDSVTTLFATQCTCCRIGSNKLVWYGLVWPATADVFLVDTNTRTKTVQKQVESIDFDKVGCKKALASKSCFV